MTESLKVEKVVGYAAEDWQVAHFVAVSRSDLNPSSRAGFGFSNNGENGALLYYEPVENSLRVRFSNGDLKTIAFTEDL